MHKLTGDCCVVSYIPYVFLVSLSEFAASLSNVSHLACVTRKFIDTALVQFLYITGLFWFVSCYRALVVLNAIPMLVCLKRFVIFLILGCSK